MQGGVFSNGEMAEQVEGARLLSEYTGKPVSRVRIPLSPPFNSPVYSGGVRKLLRNQGLFLFIVAFQKDVSYSRNLKILFQKVLQVTDIAQTDRQTEKLLLTKMSVNTNRSFSSRRSGYSRVPVFALHRRHNLWALIFANQ